MSTLTETKPQIQPQTKHHIKLASAEVANIWTSYMNDSLAICVIGAFLSHVKDSETRSVLDYALKISQAHIQKLKSLFSEAHLPIPDAMSEAQDVHKEAPQLYTDDFCLFYIQNIGKAGMLTYSTALASSARLDICEYFTECLNESARLYNKATEIMLSKGTFIRSPYIPEAKQVEYVKKESYVAGWFGDRRPLNVIEMSNIYYNLIHNQLGRTLLIGFSQVAQSQEVRDYMLRGRDIADKHVEIFGSLLSREFLPSASTWSTVPTDSTIPPFSDKLMMFHTLTLSGGGIGYYGKSLATSPRRDLSADYVRLIVEVGHYYDDGANIMINNGWLEQPPQAADRDQLANG